jgi:transcriptional regulator with XRE-family HTH domain
VKKTPYQDRDYTFGQVILTLRTKIGFTQAGLASHLGVSRRAVGDWESGKSYPKAEHLKAFISLAVKERAFQDGHEAEEIRALWNGARQKIRLDESWLSELLIPQAGNEYRSIAFIAPQPVDNRHREKRDLPIGPTPWIGRDSELVETARILANPACRLLTLLGPGGIGKTRLALELAADQIEAHSDGVAFVSLASVSLSNQMVSAIADALGLSFVGQPDPTAHLRSHLRDQHMLLVLDNFEHLMEGADLVQTQKAIINKAEVVIVRLSNQMLDNLSGGRSKLGLREAGRNKKALDLEVWDSQTGGDKPILAGLASGSQRFRIAISLALGIGQYIGNESNHIESVIIDEGFGSLDREGRESIIQELYNLSCHLKRIILVSHQEEFSRGFSTGYEIQLVDGASQVKPLAQ